MSYGYIERITRGIYFIDAAVYVCFGFSGEANKMLLLLWGGDSCSVKFFAEMCVAFVEKFIAFKA